VPVRFDPAFDRQPGWPLPWECWPFAHRTRRLI
jgi:hypothetical protein